MQANHPGLFSAVALPRHIAVFLPWCVSGSWFLLDNLLSPKFAAGRPVRGGVSTGACTCTTHCWPRGPLSVFAGRGGRSGLREHGLPCSLQLPAFMGFFIPLGLCWSCLHMPTWFLPLNPLSGCGICRAMN